MAINTGYQKCQIHIGNTKVLRAYLGSTKIYSSGNTVTYCTDTGTTYAEEAEEGASCLSPKTFTPAKSGWEFVGWRQDNTASGSVLSSLAMGDAPVTLYAVFRQKVTVTYYNGSTSASSASEYRYYNNGNVVNPNFTLMQTSLSGWTARGWTKSTEAAGNTYQLSGATFAQDSNITLYGMYYQTITVTYYNGSTSASSTSGTRYYNSGSGAVANPSFTLTQAALSGWTARGWSESTHAAGDTIYNNGATFASSRSITLYGMYYQAITVTYYNGSTSASSTSGTRYYNSGSGAVVNPSFTLTQTAISGWTARGWSTGTTGNAGITYNNGAAFARESNVTLYGMYQQNVTLTTVANGASSASTKVRYYNSGSAATVNPTFTVTNPGKSSWTFQGWSTAAGSTSVVNSAISNLALSASSTRYAVWSKYVPASQQTTGFTYMGRCKNLSYNPGGAWTATGVTRNVSSIGNNTTAGVYVSVSIGGTEVRRWYNSPGWPDNMSSGEVKETTGYPGTGGKDFTVSGSGALTGAINTTSWRFESVNFAESEVITNDVEVWIKSVTVTIPARTDWSVG